MADGLSVRPNAMKQSTGFSETGLDFDDNYQEQKNGNFENDSGYVEDRFRVDRKKLEQMLQGNWGGGDEAAEEFFQRIMDETNTQISWPSKLKIGAKSKKDPHIKVIGFPDEVKAAKDLIMAVLDTKSNRATLKMDVSYTDHSHVIGKGGNNIKRVMQETGCHVHFPDSNRGNNVQEKSNQVSIAGQPQGVETARIQIRELLPLVFMFELPVSPVPQPTPDPSSPAIQQLQQHYNVNVSFRQRARMYATMVVVRGSVCNEKLVKEATIKLMEMLIGTPPTPMAVSMQLEIAPQHHLFIIGRNGMNIKQIMQATGAAVHFPDPNTVTPQRKGTVYITGTIDSVYLARQQLIGCLPLVLMFDVKEDIDMDQARLTQLMEQLDVFISVKPKPKQPSKSVIVKSIERNAPNMYLARLLLLGLQKGLPRPVINNTAPDGTPSALSLTALGYFGQHVSMPASPAMSVSATNQVFMMNGHKTPPVVASPALITTHSPVSTTNSSPSTASHWMAPPPGIYAPLMMLQPGSTGSIQNTIDLLNQFSVNGLQKDLNQNGPLRIATALDRRPGSTCHSEANSPCRSPCDSPHSPISFRDNTVDLAGLSTASTTTASFGKIEIPDHEPSLTSSGHTMDLLGLSKTTSPPMNEISFLNSSLGNGSLHGSLNRSTLTNGDDRQTLVDDPVDLRAPGIERKNNTNLYTEGFLAFSVDYEQKKLLANKAMQQKPIGESRIPTDFWSGLGFSKSMPESAIRERLQQMGVKQRYEPPMATTFENTVGELSSEVDRDPWRDSAQLHNRPINPAPGEYPSPRKKYEFNGLSASNYIDGPLVPSKSYWSAKTDLAELFIKLGLGKYTDLFQQQEIDLATFLTLTDHDLRELGISTFGARRKMLLAIADLNKRRTLSAINDGFETPSNDPLCPSSNPFHDSQSPIGSRSDIASISGRW